LRDIQGDNAPLCTELVEGSDELILEMFVFIVARVWLLFTTTVSKHDPALLLVGILPRAKSGGCGTGGTG
jgi:hypothetical protein